MSICIEEFTSYFKNKKISLLNMEDQLLYYKLLAMLNYHDVEFTDDEVIKINIRLMVDFKHKDILRPCDVIIAGDYPKTLSYIIKNFPEQDLDILFKLCHEYTRIECLKILREY
jgi:hypothetical protein